MYQNFFYLTVALSMIVSTLVMLFLTVIVYRKNFSPGRRRRERTIGRIEDLEQANFELNQQLIKSKIEIYTEILNSPITAFSEPYNRITDKMESLKEMLNESKD